MIKYNVKELRNMLKAANKIVDNKGLLQLRRIYFMDDGRFKVCNVNATVTFGRGQYGEHVEPCAVEFKRFKKFADGFTSGDIFCDYIGRKFVAEHSSGIKCSFETFDYGDRPNHEPDSEVHRTTINILKGMHARLKRLAPFMSTDDYRENLQGVNVKQIDTATVELCATNGNIMAVDRVSSEVHGTNEDDSCRLLTEVVDVLISSKLDVFELHRHATGCAIYGEALAIEFHEYASTFPDYRRVLSSTEEQIERKTVIDKAAMVERFKQIKRLGDTWNTHVCINGEIDLSCGDDSARITCSLDYVATDQPNEVSRVNLDCNYVLAALNAIDNEVFTMATGDDKSPVRFSCAGNHFKAVVMPMRAPQ